MRTHCAFDALVSLGSLQVHPLNRNQHSADQIKRLAKILVHQGWRYPIKVSRRSGYVVSGHGRIEAAKLNGWTEVPVNYQEYDSDEIEYQDLIADNAIAEWAQLDLSGINSDIGDMGPDFDIDMLGIEDFTIEVADKEGQCDEDEVPEKVEAKTKLGDIYQLGNHRLMCGDSTSIDSIDKLIVREKIDAVCTDPPYEISYVTPRNWAKPDDSFRPIIGDDHPFSFQNIWSPDIPVWCVWGANYFCETVPSYKEGNYVVWAKAHNEDENKVFGSSFELCWMYPKHKQVIWYVRRINMGKEEHGLHPTQKPVEVIERCLEYHSLPISSAVLDFYGGSGSTLIACEKTNRRCFMMELDPHYCDIIVARWEKFTGAHAELLQSP